MAHWLTLSGQELQDAEADGTLGDLIPCCSSLYIWSREIRAPRRAYTDPDEFQKWINSVAAQTAAFIDSRDLAHCVKLTGIRIGGGKITEEKSSTLCRFSDDRRVRTYIIDVVESLTHVTPPIYVGNANNFLERTKQHLRGETELSAYLHESLDMGWSEVKVQYINLSSQPSESYNAKALQELVELIGQRVLAPIGTKRPG